VLTLPRPYRCTCIRKFEDLIKKYSDRTHEAAIELEALVSLLPGEKSRQLAQMLQTAASGCGNEGPPARPSLNHWGLGGSWNVGAESAGPQAAPGKILFRLQARDLPMVLGPSKNGKTVRFKVKLAPRPATIAELTPPLTAPARFESPVSKSAHPARGSSRRPDFRDRIP